MVKITTTHNKNQLKMKRINTIHLVCYLEKYTRSACGMRVCVCVHACDCRAENKPYSYHNNSNYESVKRL